MNSFHPETFYSARQGNCPLNPKLIGGLCIVKLLLTAPRLDFDAGCGSLRNHYLPESRQ